MKILTVILARAGSKGLVGKNSLTVAGRPMLVWTIEHAMGSSLAGKVVLSTDGDGLAEVGRSMGVEVVKRSMETANDSATVDSATRHAVLAVEAKTGKPFDVVVILYGNIPIRPSDLTDRAVTKLIESGCDSVQSIYPVEKMHPCWMKKLGGETGDELLMYEPNEIYRRQDLPPVYMLNGGVIAVTRDSLFNVDPEHPHAFLGINRRAVINEPDDVIDIDSRLDLRVAEAVLLERRESSVA
jgi:CMP-N-acetylneuraminic acid synthetase